MRGATSFTIPLALGLLGALTGSGCSALPYLMISDGKSSFTVVGSSQKAVWDDLEAVASGLGVVHVPHFLSNSEVPSTEPARSRQHGEQFWCFMSYGYPTRSASVAFPPGEWKRAATRIVSRDVRNVFGSTVCHWAYLVDVTFSIDHESYLVEVVGTGGGPEGYSVVLAWSYSHADRLMDATVVEQLPGHSARKTRLLFRVTDSCELVPAVPGLSHEVRPTGASGSPELARKLAGRYAISDIEGAADGTTDCQEPR
jgi:hypothetical protein